MARKQDPLVSLQESLQSLFSDPVGNFDAISAAVAEQQESLLAAREALQSNLQWLAALQIALQSNRLKWLREQVKQQGRGE